MTKPSKELQSQLDRLSRSGSFAVSMTLKKELKELTIQIGCTILTNMDCGTCVRKAMHDVNSYMKRSESKPVLQMKEAKQEVFDRNYTDKEFPEPPTEQINPNFVASMSFEKKVTEMTYKEMRRFAKDKGYRLKNPTKEQLINIIKNEL